MIRVITEVQNESARFHVAVRAESIRRAASLVRARYARANVRVRFPIDPEEFFVKDPAARAGLIGLDQPEPVRA